MKLTFPDEFLTCNIFILDGKRWSVPGLIQHAKAQKLEVFDLPIAHVNFDINMGGEPVTMYELAEHTIRLQKTDLSYPILMSPLGQIMDGWHRLIRAAVEGRESLPCQRFIFMPTADGGA